MASNLSSIGFVFPSEDWGRQLMAELAGYAVHRSPCLPGDYAVWRSGGGAEIWYHVVGERSFFGRMDGGRVVGLRPFFHGEGCLPISIERLIRGPGHSAFEGIFTGVALAGYPIAFEAMEFALHDLRSRPIKARAQLVGFARQITPLGIEAEVAVAAEGRGSAVRTFAGDKTIGLGNADNDNEPESERLGEVRGPPPATVALLRGVVVRHARIENEVTERSYNWLLVDGPGGTFDIVADLDIVKEPIAAGTVVEVFASFSGRLID
ncbi:MAG: hypothetical protein RLZ98_892 [Pseudomonadota bacterium]|jgi:hypothetical protein